LGFKEFPIRFRDFREDHFLSLSAKLAEDKGDDRGGLIKN
jgi:hypothetical protein